MSIRSHIFMSAAALFLAAGTAAAQETLVIRGGTVHPVAGEPYVGNVVVRDGKIAAAGQGVAVPEGAKIIDATGLHVYPGLFDAGSILGLNEVRSIEVMSDTRELGDYTPHLLARTAVHPASEHIPVARANGVTQTLSLPLGGTGFRGMGSVLHLAGWTVEEMDIEPAAVMFVEWPTRRSGSRTARELIRQFATWLDAARQYDRVTNAGGEIPRDQRLEALARVIRREIPVLARAQNEADIRAAVEFADEQNIRLIIAGAREGHKVATLLADHRVPVILGPTQSLPTSVDAPYDEAYAVPARLHEAGVKFAFGTFTSADSRLVPYQASQGIPYGLPYDVALRAVTINPAEILGIGDRLGTIEPGKIANLIVTDGDPLEIRTRILHVIIAGVERSTMNKHEQLYQTYRARPKAELIP